MTDRPEQGEPQKPAGPGAGPGRGGTPGPDDHPPSRRGGRRRRAERPGTNPSADEAPDVLAPREEPTTGETQHDRWLREQRPPHWE